MHHSEQGIDPDSRPCTADGSCKETGNGGRLRRHRSHRGQGIRCETGRGVPVRPDKTQKHDSKRPDNQVRLCL